MARVNSKRKGAAGEREFAAFCRTFGYDVRRTAQYNGKELESKADVVGLPGIHAEVKRVERLNVSEAMAQAARDSKECETPVVFHRKNGEEWLATMRAAEWFEIYGRKGENQ